MKVWIVHDSVHGNGEKLAKILGEALEKDKHTVEISHLKNVTPEKVAADDTDIIIVGGAVRKFTTDSPPKEFIKKLQIELQKANKTIKFGATFLTHAMPKKMIAGKGKRLNKALAKDQLVNSVFPEFISAQVEGFEGPFVSHVPEILDKNAVDLVAWIKK